MKIIKRLFAILLVVSLILSIACSSLEQGGGIGGTGAKIECDEIKKETENENNECTDTVKY